MYEKANKSGTLQTEQMMFEEEDYLSLDSDCMTRMMTPDDWEKYGPLITRENKNKKMQYKTTD